MHQLAMMSLGLALVAAAPQVSAEAGRYRIDTVHSSVVFRIKHLGVSYIYGRFNDAAGEFHFDPENLAATRFDVTVKAASVDTANAKRDEHLRGPDFFNAKQFPDIRFKSTEAAVVDEDTVAVTGDLSLHGVTRKVTIELDMTGHGSFGPPLGGRAGFQAVFDIKRTDFGMDYGVANGAASDEVRMFVAVQGVRD